MRNSKWNWTLVVSGGHFWLDFYVNMLPPLLPFIAVLWGLNNSQLALAVTIQSLAANLLQPVYGYLVDKSPQRWSLAVCLLFTSLPMCFLYLAKGYLPFLVLVVVGGTASALYHPLGAVQAVQGPHEEKVLKMSIFSLLGGLGFAISPAIVALVVDRGGMKSLAWLAIPGLIWLILLKVFQPREVMGQEKKREEDWVPASGKTGFMPFLVLSAIVSLRSWVITALTVFVPLWLVSQGVSERVAGMNLTYYLLAGSAGGIFFGYISPKIGNRKILIGSFLLSLPALFAYFVVPGYWRLLLLLSIGFLLLGTNPVTTVLGQELLPRQAALATGMIMGFGFAMGGIGTGLTGIMADAWGTVAALNLTSLVLIPAFVLAVFLGEPRRVDQGETPKRGVSQ